jgi:hypothetical protein
LICTDGIFGRRKAGSITDTQHGRTWAWRDPSLDMFSCSGRPAARGRAAGRRPRPYPAARRDMDQLDSPPCRSSSA